jgi:hypothetical protein
MHDLRGNAFDAMQNLVRVRMAMARKGVRLIGDKRDKTA